MRVTSTVKMNMPRIKQITTAQITALEMTGDALHTNVVQAQVIPRDKGILQGEKFFVDYSNVKNGKIILTHEGPYARRLYFHPEYKFSKKENPNAKANWFEDWEKGGKKEEFAVKAYKAFFKRVGGV